MEMPQYTNTPSPPNLDTFVHERRIIPTATVHPGENTPIIRMNRKRDSSEKRTLLFPTPCGRDDALMLVYHISSVGEHTRPTPWSQFRTV
ncbi:hypothetical protein TNCV_3470771 [Trichonephila clavipes]|nr:hypothetical protein TNCV_3470771 [Trichonephila clavipes]